MLCDLTCLNTHSGSLETIPADREVIPSLIVITGAPVFRKPTTSSRVISPTKKGVACTDTKSWFSSVANHENTTVPSPLLPLPVVLSICFGRWAKSLQDFHVLWSMMFVSLYEPGATGIKPQPIGRLVNKNIYPSTAAVEVEIISVDELNISANQQQAFISVMSGRTQAK